MLQFPSHFQQKKIQTWSFAFHFVKVGFFSPLAVVEMFILMILLKSHSLNTWLMLKQ